MSVLLVCVHLCRWSCQTYIYMEHHSGCLFPACHGFATIDKLRYRLNRVGIPIPKYHYPVQQRLAGNHGILFVIRMHTTQKFLHRTDLRSLFGNFIEPFAKTYPVLSGSKNQVKAFIAPRVIERICARRLSSFCRL